MPLIDYPDVPALAGVPPLNRLTNTTLAASALSLIGNSAALQILADFTAPVWGVYNSSGAAVLIPDSVISFEYRGESRISDYPVEQGSFSSYNKVAVPSDIRMRMSCGGLLEMSRGQFLAAMDSLKADTNLYDIVTPDAVYTGMNLEHYDYRREARNGVTLLVVEAWFREIRVSATAQYTKSASAQDPVSVGVVKTSTPTAAQTSIINGSTLQ